MANVKYFNGDTELNRPRPMDNKEFALLFPGVKGVRRDNFTRLVGGTQAPVWTDGKWDDAPLPVERMINFKSNPSLHECNARCMNATGNNCECRCGGRQHGKASFNCSAA